MRHALMQWVMKVVVALSAGLGAWTSSEAQRLIWLGGLYYRGSIAWDVSADGRVVVGWIDNSIIHGRAFRWTVETGMQDLGSLGRFRSAALGVSADGRVVVGRADNADGQWRAFRWTAETGMQDLGTLNGSESAAWGVSADGSVVVGWARNADGQQRAFRWADGVMQDLGTLGGLESLARGVSADGRVVVGGAENVYGHRRAFRWVEGRGMQDLNQVFVSLLARDSYLGEASNISPDGRYIVGWGYNAARGREEGFLLDTWRTGDTNGDGCINNDDLLAVLFAFGTPGTGYTRHEDINKDGIVDNADLLVVLFNFGQGC